MTKETYSYDVQMDKTDMYLSYVSVEAAKKRCFEGVDLKLKDNAESYLNLYIKHHHNGNNTEAMKHIRVEVIRNGTEKYIDDLYDWGVMTIYPYKIAHLYDSFKKSTNVEVSRCLELHHTMDYL